MQINADVAGGLLGFSATVTRKQAAILTISIGLGIAVAGWVMLSRTN